MIYVDTSVMLAQLLAEDRRPSEGLWGESLVSSRLLEYEVWNRMHARGEAKRRGEAVREAVGRVTLIELTPLVLARALEPFPSPLRTLDALHLATISYLHALGSAVRLATFDTRMLAAARRLKLSTYPV